VVRKYLEESDKSKLQI